MSPRAWLSTAIVAAVVVALGVVVVRLNGGRKAEAALDVLEDLARVRHQVEELEAANEELRQANATFRAAHPEAAPVATFTARTAVVTVHGAARQPPPRPRPSSSSSSSSTPAPPDPPPPAELLADGDQLEALVTGVDTEERPGGKRYVIGTVEAVRAWPPPRQSLARAAFEAELRMPPQRPHVARWGAGVAALASPRGLSYGAALGAPPVTVLGVGLELTVAGAWSPTGGPQGAALLLVRP